MKSFNTLCASIGLLVLLVTSAYAGNITVNTLASDGSPIAGQFHVQLGPNFLGTYNSGDQVALSDGQTYKIWASYLNTSTPRLMYTVAGDATLEFRTTNITIHFSGGYCNYRGSGSWRSFSRPTMELFSRDYYGNTMRFQFGKVWNDPRTMEKEIDYEGETSIEKTIAVLQLLGHDGSPISGASARGGYTTPTLWFVPGSTNANGLLLDCRDGHPANLTYEMRLHNGTQVVGPQDPSANSYYDFETELVTLRLETCDGTPLDGGHPRYGAGSNYGTSHWPNGNTGWSAPGETSAEMFQGTYSFDMQYQGTSEQKISQTVPDGGASFTWVTTKLTLNYPNQISFGGGSGDSRFFNKPSMELLSGTYKFHFRNSGGERRDISISGCEITLSCALLCVKQSDGTTGQPGVSFIYQEHGHGPDQAVPGTTNADGYLLHCIDMVSESNKVRYIPSYEHITGVRMDPYPATATSATCWTMVNLGVELLDACGDRINGASPVVTYEQPGNGRHTYGSMTDGYVEKDILPHGGYIAFFIDDYQQTKDRVDRTSQNPVSFQTSQINGGAGGYDQYRENSDPSYNAFTDGEEILTGGSIHFRNSGTAAQSTYHNIPEGVSYDATTRASAAPVCIAPLVAKSVLKDTDLHVYPNPANDEVTVNAPGEISIFSSSGQLVYHGKAGVINVSDWSKGIYLVRTAGTVEKLIVE